MDLFFLAYANSAADPLPSLMKEDDEVYRLLSRRKAEKHIDLHRESHATLDKIAEYLNRFRDDITVFHFSGHAGRDRLILEDEAANAQGIAQFLGLCPKLKLIILNGCSTKGQVEQLLKLENNPVVIATSAPVGDFAATQFSIGFYQMLCEQNANIQEAFLSGCAAAQLTAKQNIEVTEDRGELGKFSLKDDASGRSLWGKFVAPESEDSLNWTLPVQSTQQASEELEQSHPNMLIIDGLMESLSPFVPEIDDILEQEAMQSSTMYISEAESPFNPQKQRIIMQSFPYPISNHLKALFSRRKEVLDGEVFFHQFNMPRLSRLIQIYLSAIELPAFFLLGQLWDVMMVNKELKLPDEHKKLIRTFLTASPKERRMTHLFSIVPAVYDFFETHSIPVFVQEMEELIDQYQLNSPFYNACQAVELIKGRVDNRSIRESLSDQVTANCLTAEQNVTIILQHLSFLSNYLLLSVRNIDVLRNRQHIATKYLHKIVRLEINMYNQGADPTLSLANLEEYLHNYSVLIHPKGGDVKYKDFLNLTPFIFDENAFIPKSPTRKGSLKLYYFDKIDGNKDAIQYKLAFNFNDPGIRVGKKALDRQKMPLMQLIKQFDAFSRILFNQSFEKL